MGSASYTKGAKRAGGNHEWVGMNHEIHERREREIQNHEWTRMGTKGKLRITNGHEWTRMGNSEPRMDTNRWEEPRNTRKARKGNSEPRMDTNGHERNHEIQEWNHETHEIHEKRQGG